MILIADSSALVALSIVDKLDVLEKLFRDVYVPRAVYDEVSKKNKIESYKLAKEAELISEIVPLIEILRGSWIFIDDKTYALVLGMAGEL